MSKLVLPTLIFSLAIWLILGSFWLGKQHPQDQSGDTSENPVWIIEHDTFRVTANTIFAFAPFETDVIINDEQLEVLDAIALYLDRTPAKQLLLNGYFGVEEQQLNSIGNLGLARANSIKNILIRRGLPEAQVKTVGKLRENLRYNENGLISGGVGFDIFDREPFAGSEQQLTFNFAYDQDSIDSNVEIEKAVADLKQWMADHPESRLSLTVYFEGGIMKSAADEKAGIVRNFLIKKGILAERVDPYTIEKRETDPGKRSNSINRNRIQVEATAN